jgi:hypothetical protein
MTDGRVADAQLRSLAQETANACLFLADIVSSTDSRGVHRPCCIAGDANGGFGAGGGAAASGAGAMDTSAEWQCAHCTYINERPGDCEMCGLPRD